MAEIKQVTFTHREVAEALVRRQGIHEGHWGIYVEFGIAGANVGASDQTTFSRPPSSPFVSWGFKGSRKPTRSRWTPP